MNRRILLVLGVATLGGLWLGPLPELARHAFWAHMAMHMGVVALAAPLLALAVAGTALDPVRRAPAWFPAVPWSLAELVVVWAWHAPALHHAARTGWVGLVAEQTTFLAAGLVVWVSAVGGNRADRRQRAGPGIAALLLTSMHMTLLGALLALAPRPLYDHGHAGGERALSPLEDQHLGGAIMLLVGGVAYLAGGLGLAAQFFLPARRKTEVAR